MHAMVSLSIVDAFLIVLLAWSCRAVELTFELPDNERECFHEYVEKDVNCVLEFQVFTGGNNDVDVDLMSPSKQILYSEQRQQYGTHSWKTETSGEYTFCFSNKFSSVTHKMVYFDFQAGSEQPVRLEPGDGTEQMTQMETSLFKGFENLRNVIDYQKHHMMRESQGRSFAEDLNERVQYWSIAQTIVIVFSSICQIVIVRSFFSDRGYKRYGQHKANLGT